MEFLKGCLELFQAGGPMMYFILFCSFIVVAIAVERQLYYRSVGLENDEFIEQLKVVLKQGNWSYVGELCKNTPGIVAQVAGQGVECILRRSPKVEIVMEGESAVAVAKLRENLAHLSTIVTLAPLLGLLGTVIGMIGSFSVLNLKTGDAFMITGGIGEALVATASGLCVAILAMAIYSYFNHRLDRVITDLEKVSVLLVSQMDGENVK